MKYIRKTLIAFIPLLLSLFIIRGYISTNNFKGMLGYILKTSGLNVEFKKVELEGFGKLRIDDLKVKDQSGNLVIDAKKATAKINLMLPSRLSKIEVSDATVNLDRYPQNKFNVFNILKPDDKKKVTYDNTNRLGKLYFYNSVLNYTDTSYEKKIAKTLKNVNGYLEVSKSRGFSLEAKGSDGDESIKVFLDQKVNTLQSFKSMFDKTKNTDPKKKEFHLGFEFKNVNVTESLGQYVPLDMIKAKKGVLTGNLELTQKHKESVMKVKGKLDVKNGTIQYDDFDGDIENVDAVIDMKNDDITVDAKTSIENHPVTFKMNYSIPKQNVNIKLTTDNVPFKEIARYKVIKGFNVNASGNVTGELDAAVNVQSKEFTLDGKFSSPQITLANYRFRDLKTSLKMSKEQILTLENTTFHFDETINGFKVKNDVLVPKFTYNVKEKQGNGNYILTNRGSDYSVAQITGEATINKENIVTGNFNSNEISGNYVINTKEQQMNINATGRDYLTVNYGGNSYDVNPKVNNLVLKFNNKNILQSGNIQAKLKSRDNKYFDLINADVNVRNGSYNVNADVNAKGQNLRVSGTTTADMRHSYKIKTTEKGRIDVAKLLRAYGFNLKGLDKAKLPMTITANISGNGDKLSGNYELYSPYGEYIVEYEQLHAKGKINDLLSLNLDINAKMSELWVGYQRLKNVSGNLNIKNNVVHISNISNDKLQASGSFNMKNGNIRINSELKDYVVYNNIKPEVNLYIKDATMNVDGPLENMSGSIVLQPSKTTIDSTYIGDTEGIIDISKSVLNFRKFSLRENQIAGTYDMKTGLADLKLSLMEPDIPKLFEFNDLTFGTFSELSLKGDLNKFNLSGNVNFGNISYKGYKVPSLNAELEYSDGNVDKLFKYGTFNVKDLIVRGDNDEELFRTNTKFDLENIDIDYKLENQKFSLDSVQDLKDKGYSGDITLDFFFNGKPENFSTGMTINSDKVTLSGFPVEHLDVDVSANNKGVNIGQFYLEYEKNPLLLNGYFNFSPINYNISALAKNFNLDFLGLDKNIKEAGGIADIDIVFSPEQTVGTVLLNNFNYKTKDGITLVDNVNADISVDNRKLNVNRLDGGYNGGTFTVDGNLDVPVIPEDFMRTKRLELGKFELNTSLNSVKVRYGEDIDAVLTGDIVFTENHLFGNITAESGEIRAIPSFGGEEKKALSTEEEEKILKNKTIVEGIVEEVIDKILKQYTVDINLRTSKDVKLNIPNMTLVKNIKGGISGESKVLYENGEVGLTGEFIIKQGSFLLNNNRFKINNAEIRFPEQSSGSTLQIDPFIVFNASTKVGKERIEVSVTGKPSNPVIEFSSDSGLSKEQIVSLLAFNTASKGNNQDNKTADTSQDGAVVIGSVINTALNELIFSPVTGKIGETFGLSNVSVSTDFKKSEKTGEYSGATTLYIQDNLYKDKWFWNLQLKFPFQTKTENGNTSNPVGYNAWINYNVLEGLELKIGGETITKRDESTNFKPKNDLNYYFGVDFSTKADSFGDLWKKLFHRKKLETLSK